MRLSLLIAAALLASCAQSLPQSTTGGVAPDRALPERIEPGRYQNYRSVVQTWYMVHVNNARLADCVGAFTVANIGPADLALLDSYARGEIAFPKRDFDRVESSLAAKAKAAGSTREALRPYCPADVDSFPPLD